MPTARWVAIARLSVTIRDPPAEFSERSAAKFFFTFEQHWGCLCDKPNQNHMTYTGN